MSNNISLISEHNCYIMQSLTFINSMLSLPLLKCWNSSFTAYTSCTCPLTLLCTCPLSFTCPLTCSLTWLLTCPLTCSLTWLLTCPLIWYFTCPLTWYLTWYI
ncbi:hypothetical protein LXL04_026684 [Taraxacum kok-saghyz]